MTLIDRYILRQFLINFCILFMVLIGLFVLIELVMNLDEFLDTGRQHAALQAAGLSPDDPRAEQILDGDPELGRWAFIRSVTWLIWDWHAPLAVLIYVYLSGLLVVGAMGFTFTEMNRKRELTAIVTSGVSMYRLAAPILLAGGLLSVLALPIQEYIIPPLAPKLARGHDQLGYSGIRGFTVRFTPDGKGNLLSASNFDPDTKELRDVFFFDRDEHGRLRRTVIGSKAHWNDHNKGWDVFDGYVKYPGSGEARQPTRADTNAVFFPTPLSPEVLLARRNELYTHFLGLGELRELSMNPATDRARIQRIMHQRFSMLVVNMLVLLMGLPYFLSREPVHPLGQAVRAAVVCIGAWSAGLTVLQISAAQLNPVAAAWFPVVVYLPVSAWLLQRIKT